VKAIYCAAAMGVMTLGWSVACNAAEPAVYSLHQLHQAGVMPDDTAVRVHALVYQGEHGLIMVDETCSDPSSDVLGLTVPTDEAQASFDAAVKRLGSAMGCCNPRKAYFDMIVKVKFLNHYRDPAAHDPRPVRLLSAAALVKVISAVVDTPAHWRATHP